MHRRHFMWQVVTAAALGGLPALPARGATVSVAVTLPGLSTEAFWVSVAKAMMAAAGPLAIDLQLDFAERDRALHAELAVAAVRRRPDYVIAINEQQAVVRALEVAKETGTRIFLAFNGLEPGDAQKLGKPRQLVPGYLGSLIPDNEQAGHDAATAVMAAARAAGRGPDLQLVSISGLLATPAAADRLAGLERAVREDGRATLLQNIPVNWSRDEGQSRATGLIRRYRTFDGVICANDPIALGALDALARAGRKPGTDVFISGLNWEPEALTAVGDGRLVVSMGGHFLTGAFALVMLRDHADGRDWEASGVERSLPFGALTRDTAGAWVKSFGAGDWGRIPFDRLRSADGRYDFSPAHLLSTST